MYAWPPPISKPAAADEAQRCHAGLALTNRRHLVPFAALSASYFAHIGFFNPYLPLWLKDQGLGSFAISLLTSVPLPQPLTPATTKIGTLMVKK